MGEDKKERNGRVYEGEQVKNYYGNGIVKFFNEGG